MSRQYWSETNIWATSTPTAVANTASETILIPNSTIPANLMQDGRCLRMTAYGSYGTTATPSLILAIRWGGVAGTLLAKTFTNVTTSATGGGASMTSMWTLQADIQTRSNGSAGTLMTNGIATFFTSTLTTGGTVTNYGMPVPLVSNATGAPAVSTVDLTADTPLALTALWGTANAANSIQVLNFTIETLN